MEHDVLGQEVRVYMFVWEADESRLKVSVCVFFFQAEDGIRDYKVTGVQTCALPISVSEAGSSRGSSNMRLTAGVRICAGWIALTRIRCGDHSTASSRVNWLIPPLATL